MRRKRQIVLLSAALCLAACSGIKDPEVDYQSAPRMVGSTDTVFSWSYDEEDSFSQTGCRVIIKGVWDSGEIATREPRVVLPQDVLLSTLRRYRWKVEAWDADGHKRRGRASFRTGIFPAGHWTGRWIGPSRAGASQPLFRSCFTVGKGLKKAVLLISSTGGSLAWLDDKPVGGPYSAATSLYKDIVGQYREYDVTDALSKRGRHVLTAQVVAAHPALMAELHLFYKDGSHDRICTDDRWECSLDGPYTLLRDGVQYDAEEDSLTWSPAVPTGKGYALLLPDGAPLAAVGKFHPAVSRQGDSLRIFDFGRPVRAGLSVEASGGEGEVVEFRYYSAAGRQLASDRLVLGRKGRGKWRNAFSCREFQRVEALSAGGTKVKVQGDLLPPPASSWVTLRGEAEGFILDPAPASAPFAVLDTLLTRYDDRALLEKAWPALESYLSQTRRKSLEEYTLMEKFARTLGRDATPYTETLRIMNRK